MEHAAPAGQVDLAEAPHVHLVRGVWSRWRTSGGPPGGPGGDAGRGIELDPLTGLNDASKPLRSKLLNVPSLREKYLRYVKQIAEEDLDYKKLQTAIEAYVALIDREVQADTKKLSNYESFRAAVSSEQDSGGRGRMSLRSFLENRQKYLLSHPEIQKLK